jgi:uncharacterized protein (DUF1330 family)
MPFQQTRALLVTDPEKYAQYRAEIAPLLEETGGSFRYDFEVARTLKNEAPHRINRLFVLQFPDRAAKERFFSDPRYIRIRIRLFEKAVAEQTIIAEYDAAS